MDFNLGEPERMLQRLARDFATKSVQPQASEIDRSDRFPFGLAEEMGRLGLRGLPYPTQYGGGEAGYVGYSLVLEQICLDSTKRS